MNNVDINNYSHILCGNMLSFLLAIYLKLLSHDTKNTGKSEINEWDYMKLKIFAWQRKQSTKRSGNHRTG